MDCNVSLAGVVDRDLIGEAVMERSGRILSAQEKERQALLVEFMEEHSLMACNTWQNTEHSELMCTRQAWSDGQKAQIDFIMASQDWYLQDTWIDQYTYAATDHRPVRAVLSKRMICGSKPKFTKKPRSLLNWQPGDTWAEKAKEALEEDGLGNWREWVEKVRGLAQENRKDTNRRMDPLLMSLLAQYKAISSEFPRSEAFEQANVETQEASQARCHRAGHPDSCNCRQSSSWAKTKPAREMGAAGGERVLARRALVRLLQRALWRAR